MTPDITEKLLAYLDGELTMNEADEVRAALEASPELRAELEALRSTADFLVRALTPARMSTEEKARLLPPLPAEAPADAAPETPAAPTPASTPGTGAPPKPAVVPPVKHEVSKKAILDGQREQSGRVPMDERATRKSRRRPTKKIPRWQLALAQRNFRYIPHALAAALVVVMFCGWWVQSSSVDHYVTVVARSGLISDAPGSVSLVVRDARHRPVSGESVAVTLISSKGDEYDLGDDFESSATGGVEANFQVPDLEPGIYKMRVVSGGWVGASSTIELPEVEIGRAAQLLIAADKPLYKPGQTIRVRSLARKLGGGRPLANAPLSFELIDPRENKVFRSNVTCSKFGIAAVDIPLSDELIHGRYTIRVRRTDARSDDHEEISVRVEQYVLPPFRIDAGPSDRATYLLDGAKTEIAIEARYLFGKPVAGTVNVRGGNPKGVTLRDARFGWSEGATLDLDKDGKAVWSLRLPRIAWRHGVQTVRLPIQVKVTDSAEHSEERTIQLLVARTPIHVNIVAVNNARPQGRQQLAMPVVISTTSPDGRPLACDVHLTTPRSGKAIKVKTSKLGLARTEINVNSDWLATASHGRLRGQGNFRAGSLPRRGLLMRTDKSFYEAGETVNLRVLGGNGDVFVDIVKDGQTQRVSSLKAVDGTGELELPLPSTMSGLLEITAYQVRQGGHVEQASMPIFVAPASALQIKADLVDAKGAAIDTVRPGTPLKYRFQLSDADGKPVVGALSLAVVDRRVLARAESTPGLAGTVGELQRSLADADVADQVALERTRIRPGLMYHPEATDEDRQAIIGLLLAGIDPLDPPAIVHDNLQAQLAALREFKEAWQPFFNWLSTLLPGLLILWAVLVIPALRQAMVSGLVGLGLLALLAILFLGNDLKEVFFSSSSSLRSGRQQRVQYDERQAGISFDKASDNHDTANLDDGGDGGWSPPVESRPERRFAGKGTAESAGGPAAVTKRLSARARSARVRRRFVESLVWAPQLITDDAGKAEYAFTASDDITGWRALVEAVDGGGRLGTLEAGFTSFQPFFLRVDLPTHLTRNDSIRVPIALHNYAKTRQRIRVELDEADWYTLDGPRAIELELGPGEVKAHHVRLTARRFGTFRLQARAASETFSDAVRRRVRVEPDGEKIEGAVGGRLRSMTRSFSIDGAIDGTSRAWIKVYPGVAGEVLGGLEGMLRIPHGCFEQSSSTNYPNILVSRYLKATDQLTPEIKAKMDTVLRKGLQKLLSFQDRRTGGFAMYPGRRPQARLTAYALMQLVQMSKVIDIDQRIVDRVRQRVQSRLVALRGNPQQLGFACWALREAGVDSGAMRTALRELENRIARNQLTDYGRALALQSFLPVDGKGGSALADRVLSELSGKAQRSKERAFWNSNGRTMMHGYGNALSTETTALAVRALARRGRHRDLVTDAVNYLTEARNAGGMWGTTQSTAMVLLALVEAAAAGDPPTGTVTVSLRVNGESLKQQIVVSPERADLVHTLELTDWLRPGRNDVQLVVDRGDLPLTWSVNWRAYRAWKDGATKGQVALDVDYPTELRRGQRFPVRAKYRSHLRTESGPMMLELGVPPGCVVETHILRNLVRQKAIDRFEQRGRRLVLYLGSMAPGEARETAVIMRAVRPVRAKVPSSQFWAYYTPEYRDRTTPTPLTVR